MPSSVNVGGIRMSMIATSGRCCSTATKQGVGVRHRCRDLATAFDEQLDEPVPQDGAVLGDDDAHQALVLGRQHDSDGCRPTRRTAQIVSVPSTVAARLA